jgi:hypothetical protein
MPEDLIEFITIDGTKIARVTSAEILIRTTQDAVDLMGDCWYNGAAGIIMKEENLVADFFDLSTGIAGEILQKFSNYNVRLAIVGDFNKYKSKSIRDFIFESNKHRHINFVASFDEAMKMLA